MMKKKFILAPDSFKESMTAQKAAAAMERGIYSVFPDAECIKFPMADGGEGTVESLTAMTGGSICRHTVSGPFGEPVQAHYGLLTPDTAVIEIAECCGLQLISPEHRNPGKATSYGVGELIKHLLDRNISKLIVGLGGSCTNDGGAGMLTALGANFLDCAGKPIALGGLGLTHLAQIDMCKFDKRLNHLEVTVASDVKNPLTGVQGASCVFAKQKGADDAMIADLETALKNYAHVLLEQCGKNVDPMPGAGAAGGLGAAFLAFFRTKLESGIDLLLRYSRLEERIPGTEYIFTGEGSVDFQTAMGKTPSGIAKLAKRFDVPVIIFAGKVGEGLEKLYESGVQAVVRISNPADPLTKSLQDGQINMEKAVVSFLQNRYR